MGLVLFLLSTVFLSITTSSSFGETTTKTISCSNKIPVLKYKWVGLLVAYKVVYPQGPQVQAAKLIKTLKDDLHHVNQSGIHLTLHHLHGPCSPLSTQSQPFIKILDQDEARVRSLNSRLLTKTKTSTSKLIDPRTKSVDIPLKPGKSINSGNYYINIGFGTPSKSYAMIVDTGSTLTWLQCQPCTVYCHTQVGPTFDPAASNTHSFVPCSATECSGLEAATLNPSSCTKKKVCIYQASYGDSSYSIGYLSRDTLTVAPTETLPGFVYGCGQDNQGLFGQSAGLIGLSRDKLSMLGQLSSKYGYVFSYCLPTTTSTGTLSLGQSSFNPSLYKFTPMLADSMDSSLYFLRLTGISVAGKPISAPATSYRTSTIIDSGTVITRLPSDIYRALSTAFTKSMSIYKTAPAYSILDTCYMVSSKGISVPEVSLMFQGGTEVKLGAQNIVLEVETGVSCLAFAGNSDAGGRVAIIGNIQQLTFKIAYDVTNSRIGFAPGGCS